MGVKQTTDALEKGTWVMAVIVGLLCLFSAIFIGRNISSGGTRVIDKVNATAPQQQAPPAGGGLPTGK
jgi:preprotein translocase subunit SecG